MKRRPVQLRGNLCGCKNMWFSLHLPESDPSYCPFCGKMLKMDGAVGIGNDAIMNEGFDIEPDEVYDFEKGEPYEIPEELASTLDRAKDLTSKDMRIKICEFCKNEIFFNKEDAPHIKYCPYCRKEELTNITQLQDWPNQPETDLFYDEFEAMDNDFPNDPKNVGDLAGILTQIESTLSNHTVASLIGNLVSIDLKGDENTIEGVCTGYDPHADFIRVVVLGGNPRWFSLESIKSIADCGEDEGFNDETDS